MKIILFLAMSVFSISCFAQSDAGEVSISIPSSKMKDALIKDCADPMVTLVKSTGSTDYPMDAGLDCELVQRALFLAGASDDLGAGAIKAVVTFDKADFSVVQVQLFQGQKIIEDAAAMELLAQY